MPSAAELDRVDPLARCRAGFLLPPDVVYLDGNSLGPLSRRGAASLQRVTDEWRTLGIDPSAPAIAHELLHRHFDRKHGAAAYYGQAIAARVRR